MCVCERESERDRVEKLILVFGIHIAFLSDN